MSFTNGLSPQMPSFAKERMDRGSFSSWNSIEKQGSQTDRFYYLDQAVVGEFRQLSNSKRVLVNKNKNGSLLGLTELRQGRELASNFVSLTDCVVYSGDRADLDFFHQQHPMKFENWIKASNSSSHKLYEKIDQLLSLELSQRMAIELLEFADCLGHQNGCGIEINTRLSRNKLSDVLGCAHESVSRILSEWAAEGLISTDHKVITILKPEMVAKHTPDTFGLPALECLKIAG